MWEASRTETKSPRGFSRSRAKQPLHSRNFSIWRRYTLSSDGNLARVLGEAEALADKVDPIFGVGRPVLCTEIPTASLVEGTKLPKVFSQVQLSGPAASSGDSPSAPRWDSSDRADPARTAERKVKTERERLARLPAGARQYHSEVLEALASGAPTDTSCRRSLPNGSGPRAACAEEDRGGGRPAVPTYHRETYHRETGDPEGPRPCP
jgi:hypothetical protein